MSTQARQLASRAVNIQQTLGTRSAAGFLRNRRITLDEALAILIKRH